MRKHKLSLSVFTCACRNMPGWYSSSQSTCPHQQRAVYRMDAKQPCLLLCSSLPAAHPPDDPPPPQHQHHCPPPQHLLRTDRLQLRMIPMLSHRPVTVEMPPIKQQTQTVTFFLSRTRFLAENRGPGDSYNASQWLPAKKSYTIDHNILRSWLEHVVGIKGTALEWFQSYLADDFVSSLAPFHLESLKARS